MDYLADSEAPPPRYRRPASMAELTARARIGLYDERRDLRYHLRAIDRNRRTAKESENAGDLEGAIVAYTKAATLALEKIPTHREYHTFLNEEQQQYLEMVCSAWF